MDKILRSFNVTDDWAPHPWSICEVVPLIGTDGVVLAYAERAFKRDRTGLRKEFFNHDMKKVDVASPQAFAAFMSEYGLVGNRRKRSPMTDQIMDVHDEEGAARIDAMYRFH